MTDKYGLTLTDLAYFDRATQPMRRTEDGTLGQSLTVDELAEAMRRAGADESETILGSQLFPALHDVLAERGRDR